MADAKHGQVEYLQLQLTLHTTPNRADTDGDGLNDTEEVNLGADGYQTDPWSLDTDGDTVGDGAEVSGWSLNGGPLLYTSPVNPDTDRDGVPDNRDPMPLGDAFVEVSVDSGTVYGLDPRNPGSVALPFVEATINGNSTFTIERYASQYSQFTGTWINNPNDIGFSVTTTVVLGDVITEAPTFTLSFTARNDNGGSVSFDYWVYNVNIGSAKLGSVSIPAHSTLTQTLQGSPLTLNSHNQVFGKVIWGTSSGITPLGMQLTFSLTTLNPGSFTWNPVHRLSVNVPDDAGTVYVTLQMWSYDSRSGCSTPDGKCNSHTPIAIASCSTSNIATVGYQLGAPATTYSLTGGGCGTSPQLYAAPLRVTIRTVVPDRIDTFLFVSGDYSGIYNLTNPSGAITSRRYTGEPRFVAILLNVSYGPSYPLERKLALIPRSVFFDTLLYEQLRTKTPSASLAKLSFRQNDSSAQVNSDVLQFILTGDISGGDWDIFSGSIWSLLIQNRTGVPTHVGLPFDFSDPYAPQYYLPFFYSFPTEIVQLASYRALTVSRSFSYMFCYSQCNPPPPAPWWEQIWNGFVTTVTSFVTSALVLAANAFQKLVEFLGQLGRWVEQGITSAGQAVASAASAAADALEQAISWFFSMIQSILDTAFKPLIDRFNEWRHNLIDAIMSMALAVMPQQSNQAVQEPQLSLPPHGQLVTEIGTFFGLLSTIDTVFLAISSAIAGVELAAKVATWESAPLVDFLRNYLIKVIVGVVVVSAAASIVDVYLGDPIKLLPFDVTNIGDWALSFADAALLLELHFKSRFMPRYGAEVGEWGDTITGTVVGLRLVFLSLIIMSIKDIFIPFASSKFRLRADGQRILAGALIADFVDLLVGLWGFNKVKLSRIGKQIFPVTNALGEILGIASMTLAGADAAIDGAKFIRAAISRTP